MSSDSAGAGLPQPPEVEDFEATADVDDAVFSAVLLFSCFDTSAVAGFAAAVLLSVAVSAARVVAPVVVPAVATASAVASGLSALDRLTETRGAPSESALEDADRDDVRFDLDSASPSTATRVESVESARLLSDFASRLAGACVEPELDQESALLSTLSCVEAACVEAD